MRNRSFRDCVGVIAQLRAHSLPIRHAHALRTGIWPQPNRTLFDRILAAQAEIEDLPRVSKDPALRPFGIKLLW